MRLFIAIELPPWITSALEGIQRGVPGAKWVPPENMHLTLRFLGDADGAMAEDLCYELQRIDQPSFELALAGAGQFSGGGGVKTLWMGVKPLEPLLELRRKVERASRKSGFKPDSQTYRPHITLARFRHPPELERARRFLARYAGFQREPFRVSGFSLYSSELRPEGSIYRSEADFPFSDAGLGDTPFFGDWEQIRAAKPFRTK